MIAAHKRKEHGAHFIAPILGITSHIVGGLFVGNTDLVHVDTRTVETILEAHSRLQESVINWGSLLIATNGALKPGNAHTTSSHSNGKQMARGYTRTTPSAQTWLLEYPWRMAALQELNTYQ